MDHLLREMAERAPSEHMVMIIHGGLITDFLVATLPVEQIKRWHPDFLAAQSQVIPECSITVVRLEKGRYTLEYLAKTEHLLAHVPFSQKQDLQGADGES